MREDNVSVAVATYNGERYIKEQMESILSNLSEGDEIVISDDGSSDRTLEILAEYQRQQDKIQITILKGPGLGIKQNIANALSHTRGRYIFLSDQDDVWLEGKVEKIITCFQREKTKVVVHDAMVMDADLGHVLMESFFDYRGCRSGFLWNLIKNRYIGCCMAIDRSLLPLILPIPDNIEMHDQWIGMLNDATGKNSFFYHEPLLYYRRHEQNVSDFSHGTILQMLTKRGRILKKLMIRLLNAR